MAHVSDVRMGGHIASSNIHHSETSGSSSLGATVPAEL